MSILSALGDYLAEFRMKSSGEKRRSLVKYVFQAIVIVALICSPIIITKIHRKLQIQMHIREMDKFSTAQKWNLVAEGYAHIECPKDASSEIRASGYDPGKPEGLNYAVERGICTIIPNDDVEYSLHWNTHEYPDQ